MKTRTAADRLKPYASVTKLALLPYEERRAIVADLKTVLRERANYRLTSWVMLATAWVAIAVTGFVIIMGRRYG